MPWRSLRKSRTCGCPGGSAARGCSCWTIWFGLFAPKGTHAEIVTKLNDAVQRYLADSDYTTRYLKTSNYQPMKGSAEALSAQIERETAHLGAVIRASGLPVD